MICNNIKDTLVVYSERTARYLLKQGYVIVDIKADKVNSVKSVFVFKRDNNIENIMKEFLNIQKEFTTKELENKEDEKKDIAKPKSNT